MLDFIITRIGCHRIPFAVHNETGYKRLRMGLIIAISRTDVN